MAALADYLAELRCAPLEVPIEPELKGNKQKYDKQIREDQNLAAGAVLVAVLEPGKGQTSPQEGDLVYVNYSIRDEENELYYTTFSAEGGSGQAFAFQQEKGVRVPRAWEIALKGMTVGQKNLLKVKPEYGFTHPDCSMAPPVAGLPTSKVLQFELQLVQIYPADTVHAYGGPDSSVYKRVLVEGTTWESPRPPFEVTLHLTCSCPSYDGIQLSGRQYFTTVGQSPVTLQLGQGALPRGVEDALSWMSKGEVAAYVLPTALATPAPQSSSSSSSSPAVTTTQPTSSSSSPGSVVPPPPARCTQVEVRVELLDMVQVRDMTGDGQVMKKRIKEGEGEFPIDCPLHDTTVRVHYRVRQAAAPGTQPGEWAYDTRSASHQAAGTAAAAAGNPVEVDTGCGELPEAVEMCAKLMVPREVSSVLATPRYAYQGRDDCPPGVSACGSVEFEVELVGFDKEGHWQTLSMPERYELAERLKAKGNELFKKQKYQFAKARYERLLRMLESTRDFEAEEEVAKIDSYKIQVLGNMALCAMSMTDYSTAAAMCEKALTYDQDNCKLVFRLGRALSLKGDYEEAEAVLKRAKELDPSVERDVNAELQANRQRSKAAALKQKHEFKSFWDKKA